MSTYTRPGEMGRTLVSDGMPRSASEIVVLHFFRRERRMKYIGTQRVKENPTQPVSKIPRTSNPSTASVASLQVYRIAGTANMRKENTPHRNVTSSILF